jgi:membrane associated rhomboid family serine protease
MKLLQKHFQYRYSNAVIYLIIANALVFLAQLLFDGRYDRSLTYALSLNVRDVLVRGQVWAFVTYLFTHDGIRHILFNMLGLFFFGTAVERRIGSRESVLFYFTTGILAGVVSFLAYLMTGATYIQLMGASGAVYAILLAYAVLFPDSRIYIWGILPIRAPLLVLLYTGITIFSMLSGAGGNVAHLTHLAGFILPALFPVRFG